MPRFRGTRYPLLARRGLTSLSQLRGLTSWLDARYNVYSGGARQFYSADKTSLDIADNAALSTGDIDFTLFGWIYFDSLPVNTAGVAGKWGGSTDEFCIWNNAGTLTWGVGGTASPIHAPSTGRWYFYVLYHDATNNQTGISVNGAAFTTTSCPTGPSDGNSAFRLGKYHLNDIGHTGRLAKFGFSKRILTAAEVTWLYNLGNGRLYAELGQAGTDGANLLTSLSAYWNLNEPGGTDNALDAHSTNDLTPTFGELVTNGAFASDTSWTKGTGWTISGGKGNCDGTQNPATSDITQSLSLRSGASYSTSFVVSSYSAGAIVLRVADTSGTSRSANGTYAETIAAGAGATSGARANATFVGSIDDLSIKATVIPAADGPASDVASDSIGTAHGTLTNFTSSATAWKADVPTPLSGSLTTCLAFPTSGPYVAVTSGLSFSSDLTLSGWAYVDSSAGSGRRLLDLSQAGSSGLNILYTTSSGTQVGIDNAGGPTSNVLATVTTNAWHHIAATRSGTTYTLFVDGVQIGTSGGTAPTYTKLFMGSAYNGGSTWIGKLSDVRIYNTALSLSQVQQLYAGTEATGATPTARWKLDDGPQSGIGTGDPVVDWRTYGGTTQYQFLQSSASKRPLYDADAFGTGVPGIDGDGTDDILVCPTAFLSGTEGTIIYAVIVDSNGTYVVLGSEDEASNSSGVYAGVKTNKGCGGTETNALVGDSSVANAGKYIIVWRSNGTAYSMRVNGVNQTLTVQAGSDDGDWFSDETGRDNTTVFGIKRLSGEGTWLNGKINKIITSSVCLTDAECAEAERLIAAEIGVTL